MRGSLTRTCLAPLALVEIVAAPAITCDVAVEQLLGIVTRLAFRDDSNTSQAVLYAAVAVSSLLQFGPDTKTIGLQGAALRALERSAKEGINSSNICQHLATAMLLCCFEVGGIPCLTSSCLETASGGEKYRGSRTRLLTAP